MSEQMTESLLDRITTAVSGVPGVQAVVLGGSRARGWHNAQSDYDIGLYYRGSEPFDPAQLDLAARGLDDDGREGLVTPFGGWGAWVNGGGWLQVEGHAVDLLYRDIERVDRIIDEALLGRFQIGYQVGHPHGYPAIIYAGEIAVCQPLWDPQDLVAARRARLTPYPEPMRREVISRFMNEAWFCIAVAKKAVDQADLAYVTGCAYRSIACMTHALFAVNRVWLLNEKASVALVDAFAMRPEDYRHRVEAALSGMRSEPRALRRTLEALDGLIAEAAALEAA